MLDPSHDRRRRDHHHHREPGQAIFRLLCHVDTVGGVIGESGFIINHLVRDTGAKIQVEPTIPNCLERVINFIGDASIKRKIRLEGDEEERVVSQAQEALVRVFERVLEVEDTIEGVIGCRLLAGMGEIGPLMGRGGSIVDKIRESTGSKIRVLPADLIPDCASPSDELIQIMGDVLAVKKALLAVSGRLQIQSLTCRGSVDSSYAPFPNQHSEFLPHHIPLLPPLPRCSVDYAIDNALSENVDRMLSLDEGSTKLEIVFRLLCSNSVVGGVIGRGAKIVRALEEETGASIKTATPVVGYKDRVVTISAFENPEPLYSPAQIAIIRVFARSIEVGIDVGHVADFSKGEHVNARLVVASNQVDCLIDEGGRVTSDISSASNVGIQILPGDDLVPNCCGEYEKVIQIIGKYENVKSALFLVTGRLRDNLFTSTALVGAGARNYSSSASPGLDHSVRLPSSQVMGVANVSGLTDSGRGLKTFGDGLEHGSIEPAIVKNTTVEVAVPKPLFGSICGEDGSNLARLKQISGAKVMVQEPCDGEKEGKVTISGTHDQTQIAQSLLHAFVLTVS